jgi:hypothetical protein
MARAAVSQETCPGWSKLALFARRSVAMSLAILARLFCWVMLEIWIGARAATTDFFVRGDLLRGIWQVCECGFATAGQYDETGFGASRY